MQGDKELQEFRDIMKPPDTWVDAFGFKALLHFALDLRVALGFAHRLVARDGEGEACGDGYESGNFHGDLDQSGRSLFERTPRLGCIRPANGATAHRQAKPQPTARQERQARS